MSCPSGCGCPTCQLKRNFVHDAIILGGVAGQVSELYKMNMLSEADMGQLVHMCSAIVNAYTVQSAKDAGGESKTETEADATEQKKAPKKKAKPDAAK